MVKQYEIYWVNLNPTQGSEICKVRPCVIISPDCLNDLLRTVIVAPITSVIRDIRFRPQCLVNGKNGEIVLDQIRSVDKSRLQNKISNLSSSEILTIQNTLKEMLCD